MAKNLQTLEKINIIHPVEANSLFINIPHNKLKEILKSIDDEKTRVETTMERQFMIDVGGGCNLPVGALSFIIGDEIELKAFVGNLEGTKSIRGEIKGKKEEYIKLAKELAKRMNIGT